MSVLFLLPSLLLLLELVDYSYFFLLHLFIIVLLYLSFIYRGSKGVFYHTNKIYFFNNYFSNFTKLFLSFLVFGKSILSLLTNVSYLFHFRWQPLFKKSSYFGLYRACRNKWLNK